MSEFDDNPFADPFAEPSIRQATQPAANNAANSIADYDPFSVAPNTNTANNLPQLPHQPAVVTPTTIASATPPVYTQSAQQQVNSAEFQRRQDELERKAQELARKEEELRTATAATGARQDNWPPLPSSLPIGPCFYQDINVDIPLEFQKIVRMLYYLWMFHVLMLMVNVLGSLALFISAGAGETFGLSILFLLLFSPLSYICWFRPIYKAFRSDSSFNFIFFFFVFAAQIVVSVLQAVGVPSLGACGWVGVGKAFDKGSIGLGAFLVLVALASSALAAACVVMILWVHRIYRSTGASMAKAQAEFTQGVMKNEHVQGMASNAASAVVRNQFSTGPPNAAQSPAGSNASSGPRF